MERQRATLNKVTQDMRRNPGGDVTAHQKTELRGVQAKIAWVVRNTRPELAFESARLQQRVDKATIQDVVDTNALVDKAMRGAKSAVTIQALDFGTLEALAVGDSSFTNGENGSTQAGFLILLAE